MELIAFGGKEHKGIERPLKLLVPIDYFSFLSKTNGGIVLASSGTIQIPGTTAKVAPHIFLGVDIARKNYDLEYVTGLYKTQLQWDSAIFAIDFDENYFFFGRSGFMQMLKSNTSGALRDKFSDYLKSPTLWTRSFFVSTAGDISSETIKQYVLSQKTRGA